METLESAFPQDNSYYLIQSGKKIDFSATDTPLQSRLLENAIDKSNTEMNGVLDSTLIQPNVQPNQNFVIKNYMENELERNESEMAYYESIINQLASRCEDLSTEKDNLKIDLDLYIKEKQDLVSENLSLRHNIRTLQNDYETSLASMSNKFDQERIELKHEIATVRDELIANQKSLEISEIKIQNALSDISVKNEQVSQYYEEVIQLKKSVDSQELVSNDLKEKISSLEIQNQELKSEMLRLTLESQDIRNMNDALQSQLLDMEFLKDSNARLTLELNDNRNAVIELSKVSCFVFTIFLLRR